MSLSVRDARADDEAAWRGLWRDYLRFYDTDLPARVTDLTWTRILDPRSGLRARLAVTEDAVAGFALHHRHLSTWTEGMDCYLEDLFVAEAARGQGAGRTLIEDVRAIAEAHGDARLYWMADAGNARARRLYDSIVRDDGHLRYRMTL